ncbi:MAG: YdcF family protein [Candidatus Buchananbacteria bacterium]
MPKDYKPHLPVNKKYWQTVSDMIVSKKPIEDINFSLLNQALLDLGINQNSYQYVSAENFIDKEKVDQLVDESFVLLSSPILFSKNKEKARQAWDYLAESDPLEKADLIFVFGGAGDNRIKAAVKLFQDGWADKIMFSGQKASYMPDVDIPEAEYYRQQAIKMDIPAEAIIVEVEAINTPENAVNSLKVFQSLNFFPKTIILVSAEYHMKRAYLTFKSVMDWQPKLIRHSTPAIDCARDDLDKNKIGWSYLIYEYLKIYFARLIKHF